MQAIYPHFLDAARASVAAQVRALREARRWTQRELAQRIGLSQARLSEVERGGGSFTAEQLLLFAQLFNVPVSQFAPAPRPPGDGDVENALARLGAAHLHERDDVLPSERLEQVARLVKETLVVGASRLVAALAPVLVQHADRVGLARLAVELRELGLGQRLPWLIENVLAALDDQPADALPREVRVRYRRARTVFAFWLATTSPPAATAALDLFDETIRSQRSLEQVRAACSPISRRWGVVSPLHPSDFAAALEAARAAA